MIVLGVESSCDETAVALVERGRHNRVLAEQVKTQIPLHAQYGGVVPEIASRNHYEVIDFLSSLVLKETRLTPQDIDLIAFTQGPGLIGSLIIGLSFVKGLSYAHRIPLIGVDHISAHIEAAFIDNPQIEYPLIALVISGGHTSLFYQPERFDTHLIAKTRDDAVGEIMDKAAKYFGLGYPGGPILDRLYPGGDPKKFSFTQPKMSDGSIDFSFSGYKTAVIRHPAGQGLKTDTQEFKDLIASFLSSVVDYLLSKTLQASDRFPVKSVIVAGGVSRNSLVRERFTKEFERRGVPLYLPAPRFCTDNAAMIAWLGYESFTHFPDLNYFDYALNSYSRALFPRSPRHR